MMSPTEYHFEEFTLNLRRKNTALARSTNRVANAAKPLIYFASLFGVNIVRFNKSQIIKVNAFGKLRCLLMIAVIVFLLIFLRPVSWTDTSSDLPLHILTKVYGILIVFEVSYLIFVASFDNNPSYIKLLKKLDEIDTHYGTSTKTYNKLRYSSTAIIALPIFLVTGTFYLRKFSIVNIGPHLTYFMVMLQGILITFFIVQIHMKLLILSNLLINKINKEVPAVNKMITKRSLFETIYMKVLGDTKIINGKVNSHYCWFELMQIYDKIADCIYIFNEIYAGQVFVIFNMWFLCTLLTICRSLSPSVEYSEVIVNDLFMYSSINSRPIFLAKMCQLFITERDNILKMLLHHLVHSKDDLYKDQVQTMIDLIQSRKIEVSANVFTANLSTVLEFSGRSISYAVLMIQYFYVRVFQM